MYMSRDIMHCKPVKAKEMGVPMGSHHRLILLFLLAAAGSPLLAQTKAEKIDSLIQKYTDYGQFNGSVLVSERGSVILKKGYGFANFEWDIPNTPDTKFRIGSMTKQFTAMLIMQQVEKGKIGLDDPVVRYLPEYPKPQGEKVTVRHLLNHTSGTPNYTSFPGFNADRSRYRLDKLVATFSSKPLEFEPGKEWKYSNSGYVLLGAILEKATGTPYEKLLEENILRPLGMNNSGYDHFESVLKKRAAGYEKQGLFFNAGFIDMSVPFSAGAMYSTVEDLALWDRALYTDRLLSEKGKAEYFKPVLHNYAFGWSVLFLRIGESADSVLAITHGGGINGFSSLIVRIPSREQCLVLLNNAGRADLDEMARGIRGILWDAPYAGPRHSLADQLAALIKEKGLAGALVTYKDLKERKAEYFLREGEMNQLGYALLQGGKVREATEVFRLNVDAFPGSWNAYDSLGEAYMTDGQTALAIKNYERSIELNPENAGGIEALKKLRGKK